MCLYSYNVYICITHRRWYSLSLSLSLARALALSLPHLPSPYLYCYLRNSGMVHAAESEGRSGHRKSRS